AEGHPRVVGRVDVAAGVPGNVREGGRAGGAADPRRQAVADGLQLRTDAAADLAHARLEPLDVEHPEVPGVERGSGHGQSWPSRRATASPGRDRAAWGVWGAISGPPVCIGGPSRGPPSHWSSGKIGRRTRVNANRSRLDEDSPGASTSRIARAIGSKAAR